MNTFKQELVFGLIIVALLCGWAWFWTGPELQWERDLATQAPTSGEQQ